MSELEAEGLIIVERVVGFALSDAIMELDDDKYMSEATDEARSELVDPLESAIAFELEMALVSSPLSMYTPEKCQCSGDVSLRPVLDGRRRTPRCQSAPFDDAETFTGPAVLTRSFAPVEW